MPVSLDDGASSGKERDELSCQCAGAEPELGAMKFLGVFVAVPAAYFVLRFLYGKTFALMVELGLVSVVGLSIALFVRVVCSQCEEPLEREQLSKKHSRTVLFKRLQIAALSLVVGLFALERRASWLDDRAIDRRLDAQWEALDAEHERMIELGYEYNDEMETYYDPKTGETYELDYDFE